jgi:hypothetical protein
LAQPNHERVLAGIILIESVSESRRNIDEAIQKTPAAPQGMWRDPCHSHRLRYESDPIKIVLF